MITTTRHAFVGLLLASLSLLAPVAGAAPGPASAAHDTELLAIQQAWARANYVAMSEDRKEAEFEVLAQRAVAACQWPFRAT